jgi:hypothetical protein
MTPVAEEAQSDSSQAALNPARQLHPLERHRCGLLRVASSADTCGVSLRTWRWPRCSAACHPPPPPGLLSRAPEDSCPCCSTLNSKMHKRAQRHEAAQSMNLQCWPTSLFWQSGMQLVPGQSSQGPGQSLHARGRTTSKGVRPNTTSAKRRANHYHVVGAAGLRNGHTRG